MKRRYGIWCGVIVCVAAAAGLMSCQSMKPVPEPFRHDPGPVGQVRPRAVFVVGPVVERDGNEIVVSFTAGTAGGGAATGAGEGRLVDATVEVVGPDGRVLRHLASGLLGPNAPAPYAKGTTAQRLVWDGRDDSGRQVPASSKVRVGLGLKPVFDRVITWDEPSIYSRGVVGMVCGPDGTLYVTQGRVWQKSCGWPEIVAFSRDGRYLRTILPWRADIESDKAPEAGITREPDGTVSFGNMHPKEFGRRGRQVMCMAGGRLIFLPGDGTPGSSISREERRVLSLGLDGSTGPRYYGPLLPAVLKNSSFPSFLAAAPDGAVVYLSGVAAGKSSLKHVVCRAEWIDREFKPFLGEMKVPGKDDRHFNDPRGLALDAKGRLYVCDYGNDRIQVFNSGGELLNSIEITGPEQVAVHPRTGALYVLSVRDKGTEAMLRADIVEPTYQVKSLVKLSSLEDGMKRLAALDLPDRKLHMHDAGPILALDSSGVEARIWISCVGRQEPGDYLWLVADKGAALERMDTPIPRYRWPFGIGRGGSLAADRARDEVYIAGWEVPYVLRVNGWTGAIERLENVTRDIQTRLDGTTPQFPSDHPQVAGLALDAEGMLYVRLMGAWSGKENWIRRYARDGKRVAFEAVGDQIPLTQPSHGYHFGGFTVGPDGNIYAINLAAGTKARNVSEYNVLDVYGPDGNLLKPALIPFLTSGAWGPRFGPGGSMYFTESVRPCDRRKRPSGSYGSLLKFKPAGAAIRYGKDVEGAADYEIRQRATFSGSSPAEFDKAPAIFDGLEWIYYGVSRVPWDYCVCAFAAFDVDGHGRACVPEYDLHAVRLVDSAGNFMLRFGSYGNRDSAGPGSAVSVPDLPLRFPQAIAMSDEAVYIFDLNRRVMRARWSYEREAVLPMP